MAKLGAAINDTQTTIPIFDRIDSSELPSSGVVTIESELIKYTNTTDKELIGCVRGYDGTTPASHDQDTTVTLSATEANDVSFPSGVSILEGEGAPTDGPNGTGTNYSETGSLYIDRSSGSHYTNTGTKTSPVWVAAGGGSGTPGGNDTAIQFNDGGSLGGDETKLAWDSNTSKLILTDSTMEMNSSNYDFSFNPATGEVSGIQALTGPVDDDIVVNSRTGFDLNLAVADIADAINFKFSGHADFTMGDGGVLAINSSNGGTLDFQDGTGPSGETAYVAIDVDNGLQVVSKVNDLTLEAQVGTVILKAASSSINVKPKTGDSVEFDFYTSADVFTGFIGIDSLTESMRLEADINHIWLNLPNPDTSVVVSNGSSLTADPSAILMANSTSQGFLPPRMTEAERDAIATPATGLVVFNTTSNEVNFYNGTTWQSTASGAAFTPTLQAFFTGAPFTNSLTFSDTTIVQAFSMANPAHRVRVTVVSDGYQVAGADGMLARLAIDGVSEANSQMTNYGNPASTAIQNSPVSLQWIFSPGDTASHTYSAQYASSDNTSNVVFPNVVGSIIIEEIV